MRKVRVVASGPLSEIRVLGPEAWQESLPQKDAGVLRYKHRLDDAWYQELLEELSLENKRLNASRARRLVVAALLKGESFGGD